MGSHAANEESGKLEAGLGSRAKVRVCTEMLALRPTPASCLALSPAVSDLQWERVSALTGLL